MSSTYQLPPYNYTGSDGSQHKITITSYIDDTKPYPEPQYFVASQIDDNTAVVFASVVLSELAQTVDTARQSTEDSLSGIQDADYDKLMRQLGFELVTS